jgi:hypothetical protein
VAARLQTIDAVLAGYRLNPDRAPKLPLLEQVARELQKKEEKSAAQKILEYVYTRQIEEHQLAAPAFLGLAEIRLDTGDTAGAMELLRRMTLIAAEGFDNLDSAAALLMRRKHPAEALEFLQPLAKAVPWEPEYRVRLAQALIQAEKDTNSARDILAAVAAAAEAPYSARVSAAKLLAGLHSDTQLGSGELMLLAGAAPASQVNQAFYYEARLAVAEQSPGAEVKLPLLRAAVEDWPLRDGARVALFNVALASQQNQLAVNAVTPLLQGGLQAQASAAGEPDENGGAEFDWAVRYALEKLPEEQRAAIAGGLGEALQRLNRPNEALSYTQMAERLEPTSAGKQRLQHRLAQLRAELRLRAANARRRPQIQSAMEQSQTVRPRLVARSAPPPSSAPRTGGVR